MLQKTLIILLLVLGTLQAEMLTLSGSVTSDNQKMITSRFMGYVTSVNVSEGEKVKKGDILYTIDSREIDSAKKEAELSLQMYQDKYTNIMLNLNRNKRLLKKDMVAKYEVENLELAAQNLKNMIEIAKAKQQDVEHQYKYLNVRAPNSGVVISKKINAGDMAMPGMPAILLSDLTKLKILIEVAESNLAYIKYGTKVSIEIPSIKFKTIGKVSAIIPDSNPMTHTFKVKIAFKNRNKSIFPGMYAVVNIGVH